MTDLTSTGRVSTPWVAESPLMPPPDDTGWTITDVLITGWLFAVVAALPVSIIVWSLT